MLVCGYKVFSQIVKKSTNKDSDGNPIIDQPCKFHVDPSSFSSFSTNYKQTVWITHDGKSYVRGDNSGGIISGSLPKETLREDTEFILKDELGQPCKFVSVVCGFDYTLYLVSSESGVTNFKLVLCYSDKTPNPLFVNIRNRTPRALFGGDSTSGVIDTEGGIIVLTESVFESPRKQVEATFLPGGDKPVKLACCDKFVIALGMSGRVYESKMSRINFKRVKELSESTVVDVSGTSDFSFAVLNDGRVFGRGYNTECRLGLPKNFRFVSTFTLIESLKKHKIVSVFTGTYHSIFKTTENKMIVCGNNDYGQTFIPIKDKDENIVYPPKEVPKCQGFTFCVIGCDVSTAFFDMEPPPNFSNNKIIERVAIKAKASAKNEKKEIELKKEIEELKKKLLKKEEENSSLKTQNNEYEIRFKKIKQENSKLKTQNKEYESRLKKIDLDGGIELNESHKGQQDIEQIFIDSEDEEFHRVVGKIGEGATSEVFKVVDTRSGRVMCKKILKDAGDQNFKNMQNSMKEIEVLLRIRHPCVCKAIGCNMQEEVVTTNMNDDDDDDIESEPRTTIALFFEFLPYSLRRLIDSQQLCSTLKTRIAVEVAIGMSHIHSLGLMHRDLKVENVMLNGVMETKLIDFGLVHVQENSSTLTRGVGTLAYMSPEMSREENYDNKTDVYSYGVFLIVLFTGKLPNQKIHEKTANIPITLPSPSKKMSEYCINLVKRCTSPKAKNRPTFDEIIDDMLINKFSLALEIDYELVFRRYRELHK